MIYKFKNTSNNSRSITSSCKNQYFFSLTVCLFLAMLGLHCCSGFLPAVASGGSSLVVMQGFLTTVATLAVELRL